MDQIAVNVRIRILIYCRIYSVGRVPANLSWTRVGTDRSVVGFAHPNDNSSTSMICERDGSLGKWRSTRWNIEIEPRLEFCRECLTLKLK